MKAGGCGMSPPCSRRQYGGDFCFGSQKWPLKLCLTQRTSVSHLPDTPGYVLAGWGNSLAPVGMALDTSAFKVVFFLGLG